MAKLLLTVIRKGNRKGLWFWSKTHCHTSVLIMQATHTSYMWMSILYKIYVSTCASQLESPKLLDNTNFTMVLDQTWRHPFVWQKMLLAPGPRIQKVTSLGSVNWLVCAHAWECYSVAWLCWYVEINHFNSKKTLSSTSLYCVFSLKSLFVPP